MACIVFLVSGLTGCMTPPTDTAEIKDQNLDVPLPGSGQVQALKDEANEEYLIALKYWKDAGKMIDGKIGSISENVKKISAGHLNNGVAYYEEKKGDEAFQEFLQALRYDPFNGVALDYLKNRYESNRFILYLVKKGDTFATVAEAVYGTFTDAFVVVHFSDSDNKNEIIAGSVLKLPLLDSFYSQALLDYKREIGVARKLFYGRKFEKLLPVSEKILKKHPGDKEASYLVNISLLRTGETLQSQGQYDDALRILSRVEPSFENVKKRIIDTRKLQKEQLEKDTLLANSGLLLKGEMLYDQGRYLEALEVLLQVDPGFEGRKEAVVNVKKKLEIQAEIHYKEGVIFFVEENLENAIAEWEQALRLDPDHQKAMSDIVKARKLLEEFKAIN